MFSIYSNHFYFSRILYYLFIYFSPYTLSLYLNIFLMLAFPANSFLKKCLSHGKQQLSFWLGYRSLCEVCIAFSPGFLLMCMLGGRGWWLSDLSSWHPLGRTEFHSGHLALAWSSPICYGHLESEQVENLSVFLSWQSLFCLRICSCLSVFHAK